MTHPDHQRRVEEILREMRCSTRGGEQWFPTTGSHLYKFAERLARAEVENERLARRYADITDAARRAGIRELEVQPIDEGMRERAIRILHSVCWAWRGKVDACTYCGFEHIHADQEEARRHKCDAAMLLRDLRTPPAAQDDYAHTCEYGGCTEKRVAFVNGVPLCQKHLPPPTLTDCERFGGLNELGRIERLTKALVQLAQIELGHAAHRIGLTSDITMYEGELGAIARELASRSKE